MTNPVATFYQFFQVEIDIHGTSVQACAVEGPAGPQFRFESMCSLLEACKLNREILEQCVSEFDAVVARDEFLLPILTTLRDDLLPVLEARERALQEIIERKDSTVGAMVTASDHVKASHAILDELHRKFQGLGAAQVIGQVLQYLGRP